MSHVCDLNQRNQQSANSAINVTELGDIDRTVQ